MNTKIAFLSLGQSLSNMADFYESCGFNVEMSGETALRMVYRDINLAIQNAINGKVWKGPKDWRDFEEAPSLSVKRRLKIQKV